MKKWLLIGAVCFWTVLNGDIVNCRAEEVRTEIETVVRMEEVEQRVTLEGVEAGMGIPEEILVEMAGEGGADGEEAYVPVKSAEVLKEYWAEDFEFPVLFYVYDAKYYELGEYRIPRSEEGTGLEGNEEILLEVLGLSKDDYVIEKVVWDGDAYWNEEGIQCRDAVARGWKRVRDYEVVYGKEMEVVEEYPARHPEGTRVMRDGMEDAAMVEGADTDQYGQDGDLWTVIKKMTVITVAVQLVLLILLLFILLCRRLIKWARERKREKSKRYV